MTTSEETSVAAGETRVIAGIECVFGEGHLGSFGYRGEGPTYAVLATPPETGSPFWCVTLVLAGDAWCCVSQLSVDLDEAAHAALRALAVALGLDLIGRIGTEVAS